MKSYNLYLEISPAYELAIQTQQLKLLSAAVQAMDDNIRQLHVDLQHVNTRFSDFQLLYSCQLTQNVLTNVLKHFYNLMLLGHGFNPTWRDSNAVVGFL